MFEEAANVEANEHFAREADALKLAKTNEANLLDAMTGEHYENTKMYKDFATQAREDGDLAAANLFEQIAADEGDHYETYKATLAKLKVGSEKEVEKGESKKAKSDFRLGSPFQELVQASTDIRFPPPRRSRSSSVILAHAFSSGQRLLGMLRGAGRGLTSRGERRSAFCESARAYRQDPRKSLHRGSNSSMLAVLASRSEPAPTLSELGTAFGLTAAALLFLQFFSSGRYESISRQVGLDCTMGFHRVAAYVLLALALFHPVSYAADMLLVDPILAWHRLAGMVASNRLRTGVVALAGLIVIVGLATIRSRPFIRYEYWRLSHGLLVILVAGLTLQHVLAVGSYSADYPLRAVWFLSRLGRRRRHRCRLFHSTLAHVAEKSERV